MASQCMYLHTSEAVASIHGINLSTVLCKRETPIYNIHHVWVFAIQLSMVSIYPMLGFLLAKVQGCLYFTMFNTSSLSNGNHHRSIKNFSKVPFLFQILNICYMRAAHIREQNLCFWLLLLTEPCQIQQGLGL